MVTITLNVSDRLCAMLQELEQRGGMRFERHLGRVLQNYAENNKARFTREEVAAAVREDWLRDYVGTVDEDDHIIAANEAPDLRNRHNPWFSFFIKMVDRAEESLNDCMEDFFDFHPCMKSKPVIVIQKAMLAELRENMNGSLCNP